MVIEIYWELVFSDREHFQKKNMRFFQVTLGLESTTTLTSLMPGFEKEAFCSVKWLVFLRQFPGFLVIKI